MDVEQDGDGLGYAFGWSHLEEVLGMTTGDGDRIFEEKDIVKPIHPVFVIPFSTVEQTRLHFAAKTGF